MGSKTYHKKAVYKFVKKTTPKKAADTKPTFVEKPVKGDKNGGKRMVRVKRLRSDVPTYVRPGRGTSKQFFSKHARSLRPSLQEGTVAIVLAGAHKSKRVLVLKQLASGLVLITGPMKLNGCPMRRINQNYLLATKTQVDITSVKLPETINDDYFKRARHPKARKLKEAIFLHPRKKSINLLSTEKPIKPMWINKFWRLLKNIPKAQP